MPPVLNSTFNFLILTPNKDRVENDILLTCKQGNSAENGAGKFKIYVILNFSALDFLVHKIKEKEFQKSFFRSLPYFNGHPRLGPLRP